MILRPYYKNQILILFIVFILEYLTIGGCRFSIWLTLGNSIFLLDVCLLENVLRLTLLLT